MSHRGEVADADRPEPTLPESDVRAMVRLMADVAVTPGGLLPQKRRLVEGLADLVGADRYMWNVTRVEPGVSPVALSLVHNWTDTQLAAISEYNYRHPEQPMNRVLGELVSSGGTRTVTRTLEQLAEPDWWQKEQQVDPVARRMEMDTCLVCCCNVNGRPNVISAMGLHRVRGRRPWTEREARIAHVVFTEVAWLHGPETAPVEDGSSVLPLPPRQQTILTLLIDGQAPKEIASSLGLSVHTVRTYIRDIYAHFGVSGRSELLRRFMTGDGGDRPGH